MKISFTWIKKYLKTSLNINFIADILTSIGLEVESISNDIFEINITPNRSDAMSHYGIARYLYSALKFQKYDVNIINPFIDNRRQNNDNLNYNNVIIDNNNCIRYVCAIFSEIEIQDSPIWLQKILNSIGINPINNILDIINFIMYDLGQPLHVFDADKIIGNKIIIKKISKKTFFEIYDNKNIILDNEDLIIFDNETPISIAGILVSKKYNINKNTKKIFIESACYNPETIRKTCKKYGISSESSFIFSRGVDPNQVFNAFEKAATLIEKIINGHQISKQIDFYPKNINPFNINLNYKNLYKIIGEKISIKKIKDILSLLNIKISYEENNSLELLIPTYRIDLKREIDIIEEILRIYGYNKIKIPKKIKISLKEKNIYKEKIEEVFARQLISNGFYEILNISFLKKKKNYLLNNNNIINIINPLNNDMNILRFNILESMLHTISYNIKRKNFNLKLFEFGKIYSKENRNFFEKQCLGIIITNKEKYIKSENEFSFFYIKNIVHNLLKLVGITNYSQLYSTDPMMDNNILIIKYKGIDIAKLGKVKTNILRAMDLKQDVFFANIDWEYINYFFQKKKIIKFKPLSKYPWVKRDLSMLVDKKILFEEIYKLAMSIEKKYIKNIILFDVYNIDNDKKSYGISFYLEDENNTLTDKIIDITIEKIKKIFIKKLGIQFR